MDGVGCSYLPIFVWPCLTSAQPDIFFMDLPCHQQSIPETTICYPRLETGILMFFLSPECCAFDLLQLDGDKWREDEVCDFSSRQLEIMKRRLVPKSTKLDWPLSVLAAAWKRGILPASNLGIRLLDISIPVLTAHSPNCFISETYISYFISWNKPAPGSLSDKGIT